MIAVASVGPPEDLPRYKKTPMTGGLFKFMVVGGGLEPSARGFSVRSLPTELPDRICGNGFRFDASIYSNGYGPPTQELFYLSLSLRQ